MVEKFLELFERLVIAIEVLAVTNGAPPSPSPSPEPEPAPPPKWVVITARRARLFKAPTQDAITDAYLHEGTKVIVTDEKGKFLEIWFSEWDADERWWIKSDDAKPA
jgi:hypothetical protein